MDFYVLLQLTGIVLMCAALISLKQLVRIFRSRLKEVGGRLDELEKDFHDSFEVVRNDFDSVFSKYKWLHDMACVEDYFEMEKIMSRYASDDPKKLEHLNQLREVETFLAPKVGSLLIPAWEAESFLALNKDISDDHGNISVEKRFTSQVNAKEYKKQISSLEKEAKDFMRDFEKLNKKYGIK